MTRRSWGILAILPLIGLSGCSVMGDRGPALLPTRYQLRTGPYVVSSQFPISAEHPVIGQLTHLQGEVETTLGLGQDQITGPVEIFILDDKKDYLKFLSIHFPELPPRRAFFLARGGRRIIYAFLNEHIEEDLRHEATHALLHASVGDLPLWLDEGLAEYFEPPSQRSRLHPEHLARLKELASTGWEPDLPRLESLGQIDEMTPKEYSESWAWVHYLINGPAADRARLGDYLRDVQARRQPTPLSARPGEPQPQLAGELLDYLSKVEKVPASTLASGGVSVRSQSDTLKVEREPARRRSFFPWLGRIFGRDDEPAR
ncbi:DUF1570 domain-containing protein [Isosphaeraceae bacterium EP7]